MPLSLVLFNFLGQIFLDKKFAEEKSESTFAIELNKLNNTNWHCMHKDEKLNDLLSAWEDTYKKGQLTLWLFLALRDGKKYVDEMKRFVEETSNRTMICEEQSLYRCLRKFEHIGVVTHQRGKGNKGPERKYYFLTPLGEALFNQFVKRNIYLFYHEKIKQLLNF